MKLKVKCFLRIVLGRQLARQMAPTLSNVTPTIAATAGLVKQPDLHTLINRLTYSVDAASLRIQRAMQRYSQAT
jgi:hypothetical protein